MSRRPPGAPRSAPGSDDQRFLFSYQPDHSRPCSPSGVSHRYSRMVVKLGIRTHLHAIRRYSATELLGSGVNLRTVAGGSVTAAAARPRTSVMTRYLSYTRKLRMILPRVSGSSR